MTLVKSIFNVTIKHCQFITMTTYDANEILIMTPTHWIYDVVCWCHSYDHSISNIKLI